MKFFGITTHSPGDLFHVCFRDIHVRLMADVRPALTGGFLSLVRRVAPALVACVVALFCLHFAMPEFYLLERSRVDPRHSTLGAGHGGPPPGWGVEAHEAGHASWYGSPGDGFEYRTTANGETMNPEAWTCAHKSLPFGTIVLVENLLNKRTAILRVNDRGPYVAGRVVDLSRQGAAEIGLLGRGVAPVRIWLVNGVLKGHVTKAARTPGVASPQGGGPASGGGPGHDWNRWNQGRFRGLADMGPVGRAALRPGPPGGRQAPEDIGRRAGNRRLDPYINREV